MVMKKKNNIELFQSPIDILYNKLYAAAGILRNSVMADDLKNYIFPMIFLKRINDVYDDEYQKAVEEFRGNDELINKFYNFTFKIPADCRWSILRNATINIGERIEYIKGKIESENHEYLEGLFSNFDEANWSNKETLPDRVLKDLIEHFSTISFRNQDVTGDVIGQAYEILIKKFADETKESAGEFYTPREVITLMIRYLDPQAGDTIYDPACGTCGMLLEARRYINDDNRVLGKLFGQDKNVTPANMGKINLFLHGAKDFDIRYGDTLNHPQFTENDSELMKFDIVLANPPYSLKNWGADAWKEDRFGRNIYGVPPESNGDFAWIQHMISSMKEKTGKMGIVISAGVLFHKEYRAMREAMIMDNKLVAVLLLGKNLFYGTGLNPCLMFFSNSKTDNKVRFVNASTLFKRRPNQNILEEEHIDKMYELLTSDEEVEELATTVTNEDIASKGYELNVPQYVTRVIVDNTPPYSEVVDALLRNIEETDRVHAEVVKLLNEGGFIDEQRYQ